MDGLLYEEAHGSFNTLLQKSSNKITRKTLDFGFISILISMSSSESEYSDSEESSSEQSSLEDGEISEDSVKRLETFHVSNDGIDRISELPDLVLRHILCFLDMKDVILNTNRISKRWRNLWISLPVLNFDHSKWNRKNKFITFIDKVLLFRDDSIITKLCFCISTQYYEDSRVDDWMMFAARKHVEEVHLDVVIPKSKVLPDLMFNSDIQVFKLTCPGIRMQLPNSVCFAHKLRILEISNVELPKGDSKSKELILSCASLEDLSVHFCSHKHIRTLCICAPKLIKLVLENERRTGYNGSCKLQISSPNLKSVVLKGSLYEDYSLEHVSSLECATFEPPAVVDVDMLIKVLDFLQYAKNLELSGEPELISVRSLDVLDQLILQFVNLRFLKIKGWSCSSCIPTIHTLLMSSYCLETLTLGINQVRGAENWGELFQCIYCLKSIEIKGIQGCDDERKFLEFVLKNAVVLEYLTLYIHDECSSLTKKEELADFNMKIHSLPRASSSVKILPFILK